MTAVVYITLYNTGTTEQKTKERRNLMKDAQIVLERHEQRIRTIERDISDLKAVQAEIRTMNEALVTLATELKHTNEHLSTRLKVSRKCVCSKSLPRLLRLLQAG